MTHNEFKLHAFNSLIKHIVCTRIQMVLIVTKVVFGVTIIPGEAHITQTIALFSNALFEVFTFQLRRITFKLLYLLHIEYMEDYTKLFIRNAICRTIRPVPSHATKVQHMA